jgi:hypothetical protein
MTDVTKQIAALPTKRLETISVDLTGFSEAARSLVEQAERAVIDTADTYATGGDLIKIAATQAKKVDKMRTDLSGPFHAMWKFINGQFNTTKGEFDAVRKAIEPKMLAWKRAEDEKLRKAAEAEAKKLEEEALARAAEEKTEEGQDAVMETAGEAAKEVVENAGVTLQRGNYGSSTGTAKKYSTSVINQTDFLRAVIQHIDDGNKRGIELGSLVDLRKGGLNQLAKDMIAQGVKKMPGAEFIVTDSLRVY